MRVFVTGATGLVGAHSALALLAAGHDLRCLVRDAERARRYFAARGYPLDDFVVADMTDAPVIRAALADCDAVLHAAAMVDVDPLRAEAVYTANMQSIDAVIGGALDAGVGNLIWVSSLTVFFNAKATAINENSPLGNLRSAYTRSKRDGETLVRGMQAAGAPIQITYPGSVIGPEDPGLSEGNNALRIFLKTVPGTSTGIQLVDVRDLAAMHRHLLEHPHVGDAQAARYVIAGHYHGWRDLGRLLRSLTGLAIACPPIPGAVLRGLGHAVDQIRRIHPFDTRWSAEAFAFASQWNPGQSSRVLARTGLNFRATADTLADTLRWQVTAGHLQPHQIGKLSGNVPSRAETGL